MSSTQKNIFRNAMAAFFSVAFPQIILVCAALGQGHATLSRPLHLHWFFEVDDITNLTPAVGGEKIYIPLNGGNIVSLNAVDGSYAWKSDIGGVVSAAPVADMKGVYVASESFPVPSSTYYRATGAIRILSRQNGVTLWMRMLPSPLRGALISGETNIFGSTSDGHLYAIKKETGEVSWVKYDPSAFNQAPVLSGNSLYIGDREGNLFSINQTTGQTLWRYRTRKSSRTPVAIIEGAAYVGSSDGSVYAINVSTGRLRWRVRTGAAVQSLLPAGKCLLTTSLDNFVYCLSPENGKKVWKRQLAGRVEAQPLVLDDGVLLSPLAGDECVILSLQDGKKINSVYVGEDNNTEASPQLFGELFLLTTRQGLYAFSNQTDQSNSSPTGEPTPQTR